MDLVVGKSTRSRLVTKWTVIEKKFPSRSKDWFGELIYLIVSFFGIGKIP